MGIEGLIAWAGLPAVAVGTFVEGDSVAMLAGALAHRGFWGWPAAAVAAGIGAFLSDQGWFWLARRSRGHPRLARLLGRPAARRLTATLGRHPLLPLVAFRFVFGIRVAGPAVFGATGVPPLRFLLADLVAVVAWALLFTGLGYGLGAGIERAVGRLDLGRHLGLVLLGVAGVLVLLAGLWRLRRGGRRGG